MLLFHTRLFAHNSYFVQLVLTSTLGIAVLQALAARSGGAAGPGDWLRPAVLGLWTVCTVSAGMVGYQRFQGTLVHLLMSPLPPERTLFPLLGSASVFGLLAFPIAALVSWLGGMPVGLGRGAGLLVAVAATWLACVALSCCVGMLFVLTPNAMTYEALLGIPLVLLSGVFIPPENLSPVLDGIAHVLPTRSAVEALFETTADGSSIRALVESVAVSACWLALGVVLARVVVRRATVTGSVELV
jgi:ABC-2 type transport system permease protein